MGIALIPDLIGQGFIPGNSSKTREWIIFNESISCPGSLA